MCPGGVLSSLSGLLERVEGHQPLLLLLFLGIFYGVTCVCIARVKLGMELKQHLREGETEIVLVWSRVFVIV